MSKFALGEICEAYSEQRCVWYRCEITGLPGKWLAAPELYTILVPSRPAPSHDGQWTIAEHKLRKLPGNDQSEDPGVTRLKKLLEQDAASKQRTPIPAKVTTQSGVKPGQDDRKVRTP